MRHNKTLLGILGKRFLLLTIVLEFKEGENRTPLVIVKNVSKNERNMKQHS
jgi:hypothetical protein